ncbi:MAG: hypothetical protein JNK75_11800 [Betaproteobacteria bacterium]|nr:hypothetical protein [Betaproteobacteria bacterium]
MALVLLAPQAAWAKPIAFADGTTVMHERNTNMLETQAFYAPAYWWSLGPGFVRLTSDDKRTRRDIGYVQFNVLAKRWNLPAAQGNLFAFAGAGTVRSTQAGVPGARRDAVWRYGGQGDYETRSIYTSFKVDGYKAAAFSHRITTAQLGVAPYEHDYEDLATWFLLQARHYTGGLRERSPGVRRIEETLLLRLFKGPVWAELGVNRERHTQFMIMYNF